MGAYGIKVPDKNNEAAVQLAVASLPTSAGVAKPATGSRPGHENEVKVRDHLLCVCRLLAGCPIGHAVREVREGDEVAATFGCGQRTHFERVVRNSSHVTLDKSQEYPNCSVT